MSTASRSSSASKAARESPRPTRPLEGARRFVGAAGAAGALLLAAAGSRAGSSPDELALPWHSEGRVGFTVDAVGYPDSSGYGLEVYVRLPPTTLAALARDTAGAGQLDLTAELRSGYGVKRQSAHQHLVVAPNDTTDGFGKVVLLRFGTRPGSQKLKVRIEDLVSRKVGLAYVGRAVHESGEVTGTFDVAPAHQGRDLSDPEFVWAAREGGEPSPFHRTGRMVVPNPDRLYGLYSTRLEAVFSARSADSSRAWRWRARILDGRKQIVAERESLLAAGAWMWGSATFDLSTQPSGGYDLVLAAWQEGDAKPLQRTARFSVAWGREAWFRSPREAQDLVHFLVTAEEEERFILLHPGEQERWMEDYWRRRDPTPDTAGNEARDAFLRRIAIADDRYERLGLERGMFSDMGRVFIRYGEPSETMHQVIPTGDETLLQVLQELAYTEDRSLGDIHMKGPGGDMRPFEVWIYEGEIPLPLDVDPNLGHGTRHKRLVFLFVDEHGLGDYRLRYSNE